MTRETKAPIPENIKREGLFFGVMMFVLLGVWVRRGGFKARGRRGRKAKPEGG